MTKTKSLFRKAIYFIVAISLLLSGTTYSFAANSGGGVNRIFGENRYETSTAIATAVAKELKISKFSTVVVATGATFPDALSGTSFAISEKAPMILINPKKPNPTINYIKKRMPADGSGKVVILGGKNAVSKAVEAEFRKFATTKRIAGEDRYGTNLDILKETVEKGMDIMLCSGKLPYDALGAAAVGKPIMLVKDKLTPGQEKLISKTITSDSTVYIIGGEKAVPKKIESRLKSMGIRPIRIFGNSRYDTSVAIASYFFPDAKRTLLSSGDSAYDSLSGAVLASLRGCPLLLSSNTANFQPSRNYIVKKKIPKVTILGGPNACAILASGMNRDGTWYKGFFNIGKSTYYSRSDLILERNNIFKHGSNRYHANSKGMITKNQSFKFQGASYKADKDGAIKVTRKVIYLTFDDGPTKHGKRLINLLNRHGAKATFFVCPGKRTTYLYNLTRASNSGHAIGNHSYDHDWEDYRNPALYWDSVKQAGKVIKSYTGKDTYLMRFIGGSSSRIPDTYSKGVMTTLKVQAEQKGYIYFDWNVEAGDAGQDASTSSTEIYNNIISGIKGKDSAVVLCHETNSATINAIESVLVWGKKNGYTFLALDKNAPTFHLED